MLSSECLANYEAFRQQVRSNPPLTDAWGNSSEPEAGEASASGGLLSILERPGVGASNIAYHVIKGLKQRGVPQRTLGFGDPGSIRGLAPYHTFDSAIAVVDPLESWLALKNLLAGLIEAHQPKAVATHREFPWAWILSELKAEHPELQTIVACHGGPFLFRVMDTALESEVAREFSRATRVAVLSKFIRGHLQQRCDLSEEKGLLIRGGYNPELFHARDRVTSAGPLRVVYVGRLEPDKGPDRFVEAVSLARQDACSLEATILGDGGMRASLEESTSQAGLDGIIRFLGSVSSRQVAEQLRASDVLLVPSHTEGLGIQTIEALACGVTVVASRTGGLQELVRESGSGYLVSSVQEMASHLCHLDHNRNLCRELGANGPTFLQREPMDWDHVCDQWMTMLT